MILRNNGGSTDIYIGGATDSVHVSDSDLIEWTPSITMLDANGQA